MATGGPTVSGTIVNSDGQGIGGATVQFDILKSDGTLGSAYINICDENGHFIQDNMQADTNYKVTVTAEGYAPYVIEQFELGSKDTDMGDINIGTQSGISLIGADSDEDAIYFNLQGQRIDTPTGLCVKVTGAKATKIIAD